MKVLVCGGRDYKDLDRLRRTLSLLPITEVINGGASGADFLAKVWARENDIPFTIFRANWKQYGRLAGPIRNEQMLKIGKPELVVAFPGGKGTADMVRQAKAARVPVMELR